MKRDHQSFSNRRPAVLGSVLSLLLMGLLAGGARPAAAEDPVTYLSPRAREDRLAEVEQRVRQREVAALPATNILSAPATLRPAPSPGGMDAQTEERARQALHQKMAEIEEGKKTNAWTFPPPRFEKWPGLPPSTMPPTPAVAPAVAMQEKSPLQAAQEKKLYSFRAENLELKTALALFARANKLNIVPDQEVAGQITLNVENLPLDRMLQALLEAHDFSWTEDNGLIRVRSEETRTFTVDYLQMNRGGKGSSTVTLSSGGAGGAGGGSGGGGSGGGSGGGGGGGGSGGGGSGGGSGMSGSAMNLTLDNDIKFWKELEQQIKKMLSEKARENVAINMTAGIIQVTDRPSALKRVEQYLGQVNDSVVRQVDIEAKLYDVTLGDQFQWGVDWTRVAASQGGAFGFMGSPYSNPLNLTQSADPLSSTSLVKPGGGFNVSPSSLTMIFSNKNTTAIVQALAQQGTVSVISQPRLRTLNNQTAIMKVGTDMPFFTQQFQNTSTAGSQTTQSGDLLSVITVGTVLTITPQISTNGWITLDITPAISGFVEEKTSKSGLSSAPVLEIKQASSIVRLRDGQTIMMGGLIQNSSALSTRKIPLLGDIPGLGLLFQGRVDAKQKKELVIFITPTIVM